MSANDDPRPLMVELAQLIYDRHLTNSAGGNMSCRVGEHVFITPRYLGSKHRWKLREDMVLVCDLDGTVVEGDQSMVSRESRMHFACLRAFPEATGVIHAHPRYLSVFAATGRPVVPITDYTEKYGVTEVVPYYPSHSQELADAVVACLVFEHIDDVDEAIGEVARVLEPGGRFLFFLNHPLLQTPGSGWIDDQVLDPPEQYWRIGPYLHEDETAEEVEKGVFIPFITPSNCWSSGWG